MTQASLRTATTLLGRMPRAAGLLALVAGLTALAGWSLEVPALRSLIPGAVSMNPMTAVALLLLGGAIPAVAAGPAGRPVGRILAGLAGGIAAMKTAELVLGGPAGIDTLLFTDRLASGQEPYPNHMAPTTATALLLLAAAVIASSLREPVARLAPWLLLPVTAIAGFALIGYVYGIPSLYGPSSRAIPMSLPTSLALVVLAAGAVALRPDRGLAAFLVQDDAGGHVARLLLPAVLLAPPVLGALRMFGERQGWYDRPLGAALLAGVEVALFGLVVAVTARAASRADAARAGARAALEDTLAELDLRVAERTEAARRSEERYRRLVEASPDTLFVQHGGRFTYVNPAGVALFGAKDESELLGTSVFDRIHPDTHALVRARLEQLAAGHSVPMVEHRFVRLDGSLVPVEVLATPLGPGPDPGVQVVARDTTSRALLEGQLRHALKMEAIGRLAGGVAHDFNNLLMPILGYSEMIAARAAPGSEAAGHAREIERAARRAAGLTRQLLAFSRHRVTEPCILDLNETLAEVDLMLRRLLGTDVELESIPGSRAGRVLADPGQIEQVLVNLTINARDAMPRGGRLTLETRDVVLEADAAAAHPGLAPGAWVTLSVSDEGEGMSDEVKARIFDPFFTTKSIGKGTGLGLSTVHGLVQQAGGQIEVDSAPGRGTTFRIWLPQTTEGAGEGAGPRRSATDAGASAAAAGSGEVILLVDDVELVRHVTRRMLEAGGHLVVEAGGAEEAIRLFSEGSLRPRLLLSDVAMPGMRGPELARELRRLDPTLPVLLVSGYSDSSTAELAASVDVAGFLEKPFDLDTLLSAVRTALAGERVHPPR